MPIAEEDIAQITASLWRSVLGLEVQPCSQNVPPQGQEDFLTGCIEIRGAWAGAVALRCSTPLACQAAAIMFGVTPETVQTEDMRDAVGELTNILGGNLKSLVPEPCTLSLPAVSGGLNGEWDSSDKPCLSQVAFACHGQSLWVTCMERQRCGPLERPSG